MNYIVVRIIEIVVRIIDHVSVVRMRIQIHGPQLPFRGFAIKNVVVRMDIVVVVRRNNSVVRSIRARRMLRIQIHGHQHPFRGYRCRSRRDRSSWCGVIVNTVRGVARKSTTFTMIFHNRCCGGCWTPHGN